MAGGNSTESITSGEQTALISPQRHSEFKPKLRLTNKGKSPNSDRERRSLENNDTEMEDQRNKPPPRHSHMKAPSGLPKLTRETVANSDFSSGRFSVSDTDTIGTVSKKRKTEEESAQIGDLATGHSQSTTQKRKKFSPKPKTTVQDPVKSDSSKAQKSADQTSETQKNRKEDAHDAKNSESRRDSVTEWDAPPAKKAKRVSPRTKKPSLKRLAASAENKNKGFVYNRLPPPLPPAPITQEVANEVKQMREFIDNKHNAYSKLDRDLENKRLISVPRSSLVSAVIRMRIHYQMIQSNGEALRNVEDAIVVKRFEQDIGPKSDIDWVMIDATKSSEFEHNVHRKIARHGLDDVNLLETELEMFTKDNLKKKGLLDDTDEVMWDANRFLRTFQTIWNNLDAEKDDTVKDERLGPIRPREDQEVDRGVVCVTPPIQPV